MKQSLADKYLYLFLNDDDIIARHGLERVVQTLNRMPSPVLTAEHLWEGSHLAYGCVLKEGDAYQYWYSIRSDYARPFNACIAYATSRDGLCWEKPLLDLVPTLENHPTNVILATDHFVGSMSVLSAVPGDVPYHSIAFISGKAGRRRPTGIYHGQSLDGIHFEIGSAPVLANIGDRTNAYWDADRAVCMVTSRQRHRIPGQNAGLVGVKREIGLYESSDFRSWRYAGEILKADDLDPDNTELYSLTPFRYGRGFIGLLEMYHVTTQRLDMQLVWSAEGQHWQRVGRREVIFPTGASGAWDSQWVCVTSNPPELEGDKLRFWYSGASTKHASEFEHQRSLGLAVLRRDGFVALEHGAGPIGSVVTSALPAERNSCLSLNVRAPTGHFSVEVLDDALQPLPGFSHQECQLDSRDGVDIKVRWAGQSFVPAQISKQVHLVFHLYKGEFYSYRWSPVL